jgi:DNA-binding transcriptional LysR family regulator
MFDARRLPTFCEVARRGSFAAAADVLWLTPSAVSQQIAALERELGATLFQRYHRGVRLTDAGERLLAHADALLERLAQAEADLRPRVDLSPGRARLGAHLATRVVFAGWA